METLVIEVGYRDEEAEIWPDASPDERLNTTAIMLVLDNAPEALDPIGFFYEVHFSCDYAASRITYRTSKRPDALTKLRHVFGEIPEIRVVSSTI